MPPQKVTTDEFYCGPGRQTFATSWRPAGRAGEVVVFVHGLGEHLGRYDAWARKFVEVGVAFYAMDMQGHGKTIGRRGHTEAFDVIYQAVDDLIVRARHDNPGSKIHLYGHSMGGCVILGYELSRAPDAAKIIVTGPAIKPGFEPPAWKVALGKALESLLPRLALGNELDVNGISSDPAVVEAYLSDPLVHDRISTRWFNEWLRTVDAILMGANRFKKRMLFLHGAADRLTSPVASEALAKKIGKSVTCKLWPDAFHELHNEKCQDDVFDVILAFIKSP
jgi:acylglycerol lipase